MGKVLGNQNPYVCWFNENEENQRHKEMLFLYHGPYRFLASKFRSNEFRTCVSVSNK